MLRYVMYVMSCVMLCYDMLSYSVVFYSILIICYTQLNYTPILFYFILFNFNYLYVYIVLSCLICIVVSFYSYLYHRREFEYFCEETRADVDRKRNAGITPLFCVEHSAPSYGSHCWSGDDHGDDDEGEDCEEDEYVLV